MENTPSQNPEIVIMNDVACIYQIPDGDIVVISDAHIHGRVSEEFLQAFGAIEADYLVCAGDFFDFFIQENLETLHSTASNFFVLLQETIESGRIKAVIFLEGNHDTLSKLNEFLALVNLEKIYSAEEVDIKDQNLARIFHGHEQTGSPLSGEIIYSLIKRLKISHGQNIFIRPLLHAADKISINGKLSLLGIMLGSWLNSAPIIPIEIKERAIAPVRGLRQAAIGLTSQYLIAGHLHKMVDVKIEDTRLLVLPAFRKPLILHPNYIGIRITPRGDVFFEDFLRLSEEVVPIGQQI